MARTRDKDKPDFSLYLRNGVYYARRWDQEAHRYTAAKSTRKRNREAASIVANIMLERGDLRVRQDDPKAVDFILDYWQNRPQKLSSTYRATMVGYARRIRKCPDIANLRRSRVKRRHIYLVQDWLQRQGMGPRTVNVALSALTTPFAWAADREIIEHDPSSKVHRLEYVPKKRDALTFKEVHAILEAEVPIRYRGTVAISMLAGLRRGEVRALRWADVDLDNRVLHIRYNYVGKKDGLKNPKAHSEREILFGRFLSSIFEELREWNPFGEPGDFVIAQPRRGVPAGESMFMKAFRECLEAIGISETERVERNLVYHALRHTYTTRLRDVARDATVMSQTGHKSRTMVDNYSHANLADQQAAAIAFDEKLSAVSSKRPT